MYYFYLGNMILPVTPKAVTFTYGGQNKTYSLIDDGEINILKKGKLSEISFDFLLPAGNYAFKTTNNSGQETYLKRIKLLKDQKKPFQFIIVRSSSGMNFRTFTNIKVSIEDYGIKEDADNGLDMTVSIKLKEFKPYSTKRVSVQGNVATIQETRDASTSPMPTINTSIKVNAGDTLWQIAKKNYGTGDVWQKIADANGIKNPNEIAGVAELILPALGGVLK